MKFPLTDRFFVTKKKQRTTRIPIAKPIQIAAEIIILPFVYS
jgi:hypothetical protein